MEEIQLQVDGTRLVADAAKARRARGGVLLVHGFNSCAREFGDLPSQLAKAGFSVLALDLRGHGRSGGERGLIDVRRAGQDLDAGLAELRRMVKKKPLAIVGHSLGAALALAHERHAPRAKALVLAHPVDRLFDELGWAEQLGYHVLGRIGNRRARKGRSAGMLPRPPKYQDLFVSEAAARQAKAEGFLARKINIGNYAFATTMQASAWAKRVTAPTLAISSPHDKTVRPEHAEDVFAALAGPVERCTHRGGHSCWRDLDGDRLAGRVVAFLRTHMEGS